MEEMLLVTRCGQELGTNRSYKTSRQNAGNVERLTDFCIIANKWKENICVIYPRIFCFRTKNNLFVVGLVSRMKRFIQFSYTKVFC